MPLGCRLLLISGALQPSGALRGALEGSGYGVQAVRDVAQVERLLGGRPCAVVLDGRPRGLGAGSPAALGRAIQAAGCGVVTIGEVPFEVPGRLALPARLEPVALIAALEVACFGHRHGAGPAHPGQGG